MIGVVMNYRYINKPDLLTVVKSAAHMYHVSVLRILEDTNADS
jgi:hypothetical protein